MASQNVQPHQQIKFEDLSGASNGTFDNPYDALIEGTNNDIVCENVTPAILKVILT